MTPDERELLQTARHFMNTFPERHNQLSYFNAGASPADVNVKRVAGPIPPPCGTTACIAGDIALIAMPQSAAFIAGGCMIEFPDGDRENTGVFAQEQAGLTDEQANMLFYGCRTRRAVNRLIDKFLEAE